MYHFLNTAVFWLLNTLYDFVLNKHNRDDSPQSSGLWCCVGWVVPNVLKECVTFGVRVKQFKKKTAWSLNIQALWTFKMSGTICPATQHHFTGDLNPETVDVFRDGRRKNVIWLTCLFQSSDSMLLGSLQKGSLDMMGAVVELAVGGYPSKEWILKVQNTTMCTPFEVAVPTREEALEWKESIEEAARLANNRVSCGLPVLCWANIVTVFLFHVMLTLWCNIQVPCWANILTVLLFLVTLTLWCNIQVPCWANIVTVLLFHVTLTLWCNIQVPCWANIVTVLLFRVTLTLTFCGITLRCQSYLQDTQHKDLERQLRVATEMSNLIVYCRSVPFNVEKIRKNGFIFSEMSSFPETKAEKLICQQENKLFLKYHQVCDALRFFVLPSLSKSMVFQYISNKMQCYTVYYIWKLLYMFRVALPPIIGSK